MDVTLFQDEPKGKQREAALDANCLRPEEMQIRKPYSEEEIEAMRKEYIQKMGDIATLTDELERKKAEINGKLKPLGKDAAYILRNIRAGAVEVTEQVYLFDDQENGMMNIYDVNGELVTSRRLLPNERQTNVISMAHSTKTGTHE